MLFALDREDGRVVAFSSESDISRHCKDVDVRDGYWLFYADDGSPLEARFLYPDRGGDAPPPSDEFALQRAMSGRWLQERIAEVTSVEGCGLSSSAELLEMLKINRGQRISPGAGRP
jgi:hypothetical protein